ncbi:GDSL esterase/lipase [Apostasia shenzhenica]|uniref:GDSL esterase/lipase n=1 Tax=Apostasia shenzhenica TaxID=1088818 RepID=A0A2I0AXG0_9ASPA|nr:GDSL esterase/lipase [Apostasia shenzhenica]
MAFTASRLLLIVFLVPPSFSSPLPPPPHHFSKIYAFGDSFTDTGNTHSGTGPYAFGYVSRPPYGSTFFHRPTNRYSDGRLVVDFLADALSLPFLPPYRSSPSSPHGVNFAVAGSTALDHEVFVMNNVTIDYTPESLGTQMKWFEGFLARRGCRAARSEECESAMRGALIWFGEIGVNDYAYSFGSSLSPDFIQTETVKTVISSLQEILNKGAKHIVVQGLPLIGCLPLSLFLTSPEDRDETGCSASINRRASSHNALLQNKLQELRRQHPAAVISYADYYNAHLTVMKNPKANGFMEPFRTCCGAGGGSYNFNIFATCGSPQATRACSEPWRYVNWDGVHLTEAMYKRVADLFFHGGFCKPAFDVMLRSKEN